MLQFRPSVVRVILRKELIDILRDRRTLFMMVVVPILLYPLLLIIVMQLAVLQAGRLEEQTSNVVLIGETFAPSVVADYDSAALIECVDSVGWRGAISSGDLDAAVEFGEGFEDSIAVGALAEVTVYYNSSREFSRRTRARLEAPLEQYRESTIHRRIVELGADPAVLEPFAVTEADLASQQQQQGVAVGSILGYLLVFMVLTGAFYAAIDLTAGEKERGTLETLLVTPVSRQEIVYGKFFAAVTASVITAILNITSMGLTAVYGMRLLGEEAGSLSQIAIDPFSFLMVLLVVVPLAVLFSGVCLAIAVTARNYKEGQSALTPVMVVVILPAMVAWLPGVEMTATMALIPITNVVLLTIEFMQGHYPLLESLLTVGTTSLFAVLSLGWVTHQFQQESVLFRHAEDIKWSPFRRRTTPPPSPYPSSSTALLTAAVLLIGLGLAGSLAADLGVVRSILLNQAILLAPVLFIVYRGRYSPPTVLGLRAPRPGVWGAALLVSVGGWLTTIELTALAHTVFPIPEDLLKSFEELFRSLGELSTLQALTLVAVLPALCEELLCRGFLLRSFQARLGPTAAIVVVAIIFGLLHMNPYRLLPTITLGVLLGMLAYLSGSIYPAMFAHFLNNALTYSVEKHSEWIEGLSWLAAEESDYLPAWLVIAGVVTLGVGLLWLWKAGSEGRGSGADGQPTGPFASG